MQIASLFIIFLISSLLIFNSSAASIYDTLCKRVDIKEKCNENSTWAFDEKLKKCYPVVQGKEPCGFFVEQKACINICIVTKSPKIQI